MLVCGQFDVDGLGQCGVDIDGKTVPISPGMNITAEIKTGQRRIIEFLLSPVQRAGPESFRERCGLNNI